MTSKRQTRSLLPLLAGLLLTLLLAVPALADTVTIVPDGVVSAGGWSGVSAGNLSDDPTGGGAGDGSYATITGALDTFSVSMSNDPLYSGAVINSVTVWVRASVVGGAGAGERITFGSSAPVVSTSGTNTLSDDPTRDNFSFAVSGIASSADVDALQVAVNTTALAGGEEARVFEVWAVVNYTPAAGLNQITTCDGCHGQPPVEGASRNASPGAVVGSHAAHGVYACTICHPNNAVLNHRGGQGANGTEGQIDMLANIQGGSYSLGSAGFPQDNEDGTGLGFCSSVTCHGGVATPQWGSVAGLACDSCHGAPPATNAHATHYTAKNWGATDTAGVHCIECHPDNTAGHSDVTDGAVIVNAGLSPSGVSPAISCGTAPVLGCHNGKSTPLWDTAVAITCTNCHTPGGANIADPQTGLHNMTVAGVQKHNDTLDDGNAGNGVGCTECHTTKPATHADGTFNADASNNTDRFITRVGLTWTDAGAGSGTCAGAGLSGCHSDGGAWSRLWSTAANSSATTAGDPRCAVCHGQFGNWRAGTSHGETFGTTTSTKGQSHNGQGGTANGCEDCHSYVSLSGNHNTSPTHQITMNDGGATNVTETGGLAYCAACHSNDGAYSASGTHTFKQSVFPLQTVNGANDPIGSCTGCHGGGTSGASSANYWPDGSNGNAENTAGNNKHLTHMTRLAQKRYGETIAQLLTDNGNGTADAKQKSLCDYCHQASGGNDGDHGVSANLPAEVFPVGYNKTLWNTAGSSVYNAGTDTCSSVECHNSKTTTDGTYGWYDTGTSTCTMCHTVGGAGANPTSGLHNVNAGLTVTGKRHDDTLKPASGCAACHGMPAIAPASTHINGTFTADSSSNTDRGLTGLYTDGAANSGTCSGGIAGAAGCHDGPGDAGTWQRKWSNTADDGGTAPCANCHGGVAGSAWTFGSDNVVGDGNVSHLRNWDGDGSAEVMLNHSSANACNTCHVYPDAPYNSTWGTGNHGNDKIDMNSTVGYDNANWNCTGACHSGAANTGHNLEDSGWTDNPLAGPGLSCTGCHDGAGTQQFKVGPASSHTDPDGAGGTYAAGAGNCEVCHFDSHATRTSGVSTKWDSRTMGTDYTADGKIYFKKLAGTENYEAEVCWNCHWGNNMPSISPLIKEFGATQGAYQTGTLSQRNWYNATWSSANFSYKNGTIQSIHQAQSDMTVNPTKDISLAATDVGTIGCSSCHDVHKVGNGGFTPTAAPYLRGSWTSNPFKEDGAPQNGQTMSSARGAVPRGHDDKGGKSNGIGGWQIEQNNTTFANTTYSGASGFAGLCANCHTQGGLEGIAWSGHKGVVSGFTGNTSNNIFSTAQRGSGSGGGSYQKGHMSYQGTTTARSGSWIGGLRNNRQWSDGIQPRDIDSLQTGGTNIVYSAGSVTTISMDGTTYQNNFHNFPCAKCHSPHASRLPRLMITNCLDVKHNTWDDGQGIPANWTPGTYNAKQLAYSPTAQNCHRYVSGTDTNRELNAEAGWNSVTPW